MSMYVKVREGSFLAENIRHFEFLPGKPPKMTKNIFFKVVIYVKWLQKSGSHLYSKIPPKYQALPPTPNHRNTL